MSQHSETQGSHGRADQRSETQGSHGRAAQRPGVASGSTASDETVIELPEVQLRTIRVVHWGMVVWAIALAVVLVMPPLREGGRSWWVWVPVAGLGLGVIGHIYLRRGRGNAAEA
ncbi:MAG TPA: DUF2530 domain-containing protein [Ornithinicoccus sp.]|nr:DUF2530 domain-containing protein [Ornithinicoccus sp.]